MQKNKLCQSCAMPLEKETDFGTNQNGEKNEDYCRYCFQKGSFTQPELSLEAMILHLASFHKKMNISEDNAKKFAQKLLPTLKRWKKDAHNQK